MYVLVKSAPKNRLMEMEINQGKAIQPLNDIDKTAENAKYPPIIMVNRKEGEEAFTTGDATNFFSSMSAKVNPPMPFHAAI